MENRQSIGNVLKQSRENKGLSLADVHQATKITEQNLAALEEDRFDSFPNRVYARAFLRDYSNYLSLDSAELLTRYEEEWNGAQAAQTPAAVSGKSPWRAVGITILVLAVLTGAVLAAYYAYMQGVSPRKHVTRSHKPKPDLVETTTPSTPPSSPPPNAPATGQPAVGTQPAPAPAAPEKMTLQVAAFLPVWVRVVADGKAVFQDTMPKGDVKTFEGVKTIYIRAGMANAVQLKLNGQTQPPLGPDARTAGERTFTAPVPPAQPAAPAPAAPAPAN